MEIMLGYKKLCWSSPSGDLDKFLDTINLDLLLAKLHACGFMK